MVGKLVVLALACFHEASVAAPLEAAWRISEAAKLDLQSVAQELPGVEELNSCPGINQEPTDLERDFASKPYYKYFTYDTYDARTWSTLAGLDTCLRSVTDEWIGASDLWEANQLLFERFGQQVDKSMWWKQLWIEWDPLPDNKTILSTFPQASAPMSSMPPSSWIQQPCNAMSNAAYFEVSLYACQAASVTDFQGAWPWKSEVIAAGALMAFSSFAMHGNPSTGDYHEETGERDLDPSRDMPFNTRAMDNYAMDVLFFLLFQATVKTLAVDPQDPNLAPVLGLITHESLCAVYSDCRYPDSRTLVQGYQEILMGDPKHWHRITDMWEVLAPNYKVASCGLVLTAIRFILNDHLFGSAAPLLYTSVCDQLVGSLMAEGESEAARQQFCTSGSDWQKALFAVEWRFPKDIAKSTEMLVTVLESLVEGMYWQETLVGPAGYLDPYLKKQVVDIPACWRQTHANWHRIAAQLMKELMELLLVDSQTMTLTTPTEDDKQKAWDSINLVASEFIVFANAVRMMKTADQVNLCRVFKLAKQVAASGQPLEYEIMPILNAEGLNELLRTTLQQNDPLRDIKLVDDLSVDDPTGACFYFLKDVKLDSLRGLSTVQLSDFSLDGQYVDESSYENTALKFQVGLETCPATLRVKASAKFIKNGQKGDFVANRLLCERLEWKVDIEIDLTISISKVVAWAQAVFQKIFTQPDQALTGGAEEVKIKIHHLQMPKFEISNMVGEEVLKDLANELLKTRLRTELEKLVEKNLQKALDSAISGAVQKAGTQIPLGDERRLATCTGSGEVGLSAAERGWYLSGFLALAGLAL